MLVLSRKKDETVILRVPGRKDDIQITVTRIDSPNKVRLGIEAERDVVVLRSELEGNGHKNGKLLTAAAANA